MGVVFDPQNFGVKVVVLEFLHPLLAFGFVVLGGLNQNPCNCLILLAGKEVVLTAVASTGTMVDCLTTADGGPVGFLFLDKG